MYSIKEKCETAKTQGGHTCTVSLKKTVTSLKFKTVFAQENQLYLHRNDNSLISKVQKILCLFYDFTNKSRLGTNAKDNW